MRVHRYRSYSREERDDQEDPAEAVQTFVSKSMLHEIRDPACGLNRGDEPAKNIEKRDDEDEIQEPGQDGVFAGDFEGGSRKRQRARADQDRYSIGGSGEDADRLLKPLRFADYLILARSESYSL